MLIGYLPGPSAKFDSLIPLYFLGMVMGDLLCPGSWLTTGPDTLPSIPGALLNACIASPLLSPRLRGRLLRQLGLDVRGNISPGCYFGSTDIAIGNSYLNREVLIDANAPVRIGDDCAIGMRTTIITSTHTIGPSSRRAGQPQSAPVTIADGCWLGACVTVLPGVTIGAGCVIATGAVVTKDCEPNGLYAGIPARRVRDLELAAAAQHGR